jgi:hypothetical protein
MPGGAFGEIPAGAASAVLADGRLLVAGGSANDGQPSAQIAIYAPDSGEWTIAGNMSEARAGHTATALADGRVLIAGGRTPEGVTSSIEIYDPAAGVSAPAGALSLPRMHHAAARLLDKRVLIVGGSDGNAPLAIAEMFDPETGSITPLSASLSTPRMKHSATTLLDGHVLVAGGNDGAKDLATTEMFYVEHGVFLPTSSMGSPRSGHLAMLLPNNNLLLIAGGSSNGTPLASVERFSHRFESEMFLADSNAMAAPRTGAVAVPTPREGVVLVGGGGSAEAELYGFATVKTDKYDYAPYETVTISGTGWQPGETVHLRVSEDSDSHYDWVLEAVADDSGNIINRDFYPRNDEVYQHIGMRFYLTAVGIASDAQATFTDANKTNTSLSSSPNPSTPGQTVTFIATVRGGDSQGLGLLVAEGSVRFYDQTTAQKNDCSDGKNGVLLGSGPVAVNASGQASVVISFTSGGTYPIQACYIGTQAPGNGQGTHDSASPQITQTVNATRDQAAVTVSAPASATYQQTGLSAVASGGSGTGDYSYSHAASTACTVNSTTGALAITSGTGTCDITATRAGDANYDPSAPSTPASVTIKKARITVTADAKSKEYGEDDPALTYKVTTGSLASGDSFSGALTRTAGEAVGSYVIKQGTLSAGSNYDLDFVGADLTISARSITVTADAQTKVYGELDPALTYKVTTGSLAFSDGFSGELSRDANEAVGSYAIAQGTLALSTNYELTFVGANLTITAREITVTADPQTKVYGEADPALTYQVTAGSLVNGDSINGALARAAGESVTGGPYAINKGTLSAGSNYDLDFVGANLTITAREITVTANVKTKVYGDADPALTYQVTEGSLAFTDSFTGALSREAGEAVGSHPITQGTLALSANYDLHYVGANLTISKATLTVTADNKSRPYGDPNPSLTATFAGFKFAESLATSGVAGTPALATLAAQSSPVGPYDITAGLGTLTSGNYTFAFVDGTLTVEKAGLEIKANDASRPYGVANPTFSGSYSGQKNGETFTLSFSTSATISSAVGSYPIEPSATGATIDNYDVKPTNGTLTISAWSLNGFYQPVGETSSIVSAPGAVQPVVSSATVWNSIKGGQTVPMKFNIYRAAGGAQVTTVADAFTGAGFSAYQLPNCSGIYTVDEIPLTDLSTGGTELRYDGTQFIQNWKTPRVAGADLCFRAMVTAKDGSTITAFFKVKK